MARRSSSATHDEGIDIVRVYLNQIGTIPLLTKEQEYQLGETMSEGRRARERLDRDDIADSTERRTARWAAREGEKAYETLVRANLRLVVHEAKKRLHPDALPQLDRIQEGCLGLMRAAERFDHRRGFKFSTYATWWIRQAIDRGEAKGARNIRVPGEVVGRQRQIRWSQYDYYAEHGRYPTMSELTRLLNYTPEQYRAADGAVHTTSLYALLEPDDLSEQGVWSAVDVAAWESEGRPDVADGIIEDEIAHHVRRAVQALPESQRDYIEQYYGLRGDGPRQQKAIARDMNLSSDQMRGVAKTALSNLRRQLRTVPD